MKLFSELCLKLPKKLKTTNWENEMSPGKMR